MERTKSPRKSQRGKRFTADYIDYSQAMLKGRTLLWEDKPIIGFYIILSINTGLRISDVLKLKHSDLNNLRTGDFLHLTENKTKHRRPIQINGKITDAYGYLRDKLTESGVYHEDDYIFKSRKGTVYRTETLNTILKEVFRGYAKNISSHSLRKTFGRHVYEVNGRSENALTLLSEIFQHSTQSVTRRYLGLRQEEIGNVYMTL